jgi:SNF2 family DNA or RNA helicase
MGSGAVSRFQELFSLLHILDPDRWENWHAFSREFCGGKDRPQNAEQAQAITEMLKPLLLRRMKEDVETLPTKEEIIVWVELTKEQKKYYRAIYENRIDVLMASNKNLPNMRNVAMELRKVSGPPCHVFSVFPPRVG